jgi:beta-phosphoglucomutase family hydrolase
MIKAVIFDMDGVIIDSEPIHHNMEKELFNKLGIQVDEDEHNTFVGKTDRDIWGYLKEKHQLTDTIEELLENKVNTFINYVVTREDVKPIDGIVNLLDRLHKRGLKIGLASSSSMKVIEAVINKLDLKKYFDAVVSGENMKRGKPEPDIFLHTAKLLNTLPENCLVIEDSKNGVYAAKAANMKCIGYKNINSGNQDLSKADIVVSSYYDIDLDTILK